MTSHSEWLQFESCHSGLRGSFGNYTMQPPLLMFSQSGSRWALAQQGTQSRVANQLRFAKFQRDSMVVEN